MTEYEKLKKIFDETGAECPPGYKQGYKRWGEGRTRLMENAVPDGGFGSETPKRKILKEDVVYISGPMRGCDFLNFPAFFAMEAWLRRKYGCKVLNPAKNEPGLAWDQYIVIDLAMVSVCSIIVMLNEWKKSEGATTERYEAGRMGMGIVEERELMAEGWTTGA